MDHQYVLLDRETGERHGDSRYASLATAKWAAQRASTGSTAVVVAAEIADGIYHYEEGTMDTLEGWIDVWQGLVSEETEDGWEECQALVSVFYEDGRPVLLSVDVPNYCSDEIETWFSATFPDFSLSWAGVPTNEDCLVATIH